MDRLLYLGSGRSIGSGRSRRSDGWYQEAVEGAMDHEEVEGTIDGTNDGSGSSQWIYKDYYLY